MWTIHKLKRTRVYDPDSISSKSLLEQQGAEAEDDGLETGISPWEFTVEDVERFPALRKRNFWCIQRHQARAHHYDLRMQLDGSTFSWAIPRGLLGMSKGGEANRLAVETSLHPISYTVHEGSDGRILPSGERCGTLLWDIGTYSIGYPWTGGEDSDSDHEQRRKRRKGENKSSILMSDDSDDPTGQHEEDKFRMAMTRKLKPGQSRSIHFILKGGYKMNDHHFILILSPGPAWAPTYSRNGQIKKNWFIRLPRGVEGYSWGEGGEEGEQYGRSVKTGRTLKEVCGDDRVPLQIWDTEMGKFASWKEDPDEVKEEVKQSSQSS